MPAPVATKRSGFWRGALLLLLSAATLVLAGVWLNSRRTEWLADEWQRDLTELPDDRLTPRLRQAADLGEAGIPLLTAGLCSSREALAAAAADVLDEELYRWTALSPAETLPRRACLAESLAACVETADDPARLRAAELAERLLAWPSDAQAPSTRVILACQRIFLARPAEAPSRWR